MRIVIEQIYRHEVTKSSNGHLYNDPSEMLIKNIVAKSARGKSLHNE